MTHVVSAILCSACLLGCAGRSAIPTLALHGIAVLHRGQLSTQQRHASDFSLTVQLSFMTEHRKLTHALMADTRALATPTPSEPCLQRALCEWELLAEESALVALGVAP